MNTLLEHPLVIRLGWTLLHFVWQGAAIAVVLVVLLQLTRSAKPRVRYALSCAALVVMAICPVITLSITTAAAAQHGATMAVSSSTPSQPLAVTAELPERLDLQSDALQTAPETAVPFPARSSLPAATAERLHSLWQAAF